MIVVDDHGGPLPMVHLSTMVPSSRLLRNFNSATSHTQHPTPKMSNSSRNLSIDSPAVTVLLDRITDEMGDDRLSQLIRQNLVEAFERAKASENEAIKQAESLQAECSSLSQTKEELKAEKAALQEHQQALNAAAESLNALPSRVQDLSDQFEKLNTDLAEERLAER